MGSPRFAEVGVAGCCGGWGEAPKGGGGGAREGGGIGELTGAGDLEPARDFESS